MKKQLKSLLISGIISVTTLGLVACTEEQQATPIGRPTPGVNTVTLVPYSVVLYNEMPGRTLAFEEAEVRPEVTGIIQERVFTEGAYVEKGQTLYLIESELYKASYDSAQASLERAEAAMNVASLKEQRTATLRRQNSISQQDYDEVRAVYLQARAEVAAATAAVTTAKINLDRTHIQAPISGLIGKSTVSVGNLLANNQANALTTIYQINPMNVDLTQSVQELVRIRQRLESQQDNEVSFNQTDDLGLPVQLILNDDQEYKHLGTLRFVDVGVNADTATMTLRAEFPNPDYLLMPGLFVRAKVQVGVDKDAILIPQRAILRDTKGIPYVYLATNLDAGLVAQRRSITLGDTYAEYWLVLDGLKAGESIILEGLQNITEGSPIQVLKNTDLEISTDSPFLYKNAISHAKEDNQIDIQNATNENNKEIETTKDSQIVEEELKGEE